MKNQNEIWKHIETTNREMGEVQTDIKWIREKIKSLDEKTAKKRDLSSIKWVIGFNSAMLIALLGIIARGVV